MYTTCLHCHSPLGANDVIEHFTVGRRLAFDGAKGRLWVVCGKCRRWNLTPLEERWEAIEECERAFERTRLRASSGQIALARIPGGLDLVRVGPALFPEIAAWRYGKSLHSRWKTRAIPLSALGVSGYAGQILMNAGIIGAGTVLGMVAITVLPAILLTVRNSRVGVMLPDGNVMQVKHHKTHAVQLETDAVHGWALRLDDDKVRARATGAAAAHGLRSILTVSNFFGGRAREIDAAITSLNDAGDSRRFLERVARVGPVHGASNVNLLPPEVRIALEMALHEDVERQAMEGELAALSDEWRLAEELAGIADNLFLGDGILGRLSALRPGGSQ